nr:13535_t:CDS:2 [Entrophospora candida]
MDQEIINKSFRNSFNKIYKKYPNYGYHHNVNTKDWWNMVIKETLLESGLHEKKLGEIFELLSDSLYNIFKTSQAYELFPEIEKPSKLIFQKALDIINDDNKNFITDKESLHVGDNEEKDYFGAIDSGFGALLLKRQSYSSNKSSLIISNLGQVLNYLKIK